MEKGAFHGFSATPGSSEHGPPHPRVGGRGVPNYVALGSGDRYYVRYAEGSWDFQGPDLMERAVRV